MSILNYHVQPSLIVQLSLLITKFDGDFKYKNLFLRQTAYSIWYTTCISLKNENFIMVMTRIILSFLEHHINIKVHIVEIMNIISIT